MVATTWRDFPSSKSKTRYHFLYTGKCFDSIFVGTNFWFQQVYLNNEIFSLYFHKRVQLFCFDVCLVLAYNGLIHRALFVQLVAVCRLHT